MNYTFANHIVMQILGSLIEACYILSRRSSRFRRKQEFQEREQKAKGVTVSLTVTGLKGPLVKDMTGFENARLFSNIFISKWKMRCLMTAWRSHRPLYLWSTGLHDLDFHVKQRKRRLDGRWFSQVFHFRFQYFYGNDDRPVVLIEFWFWFQYAFGVAMLLRVYFFLFCFSSFAFFFF